MANEKRHPAKSFAWLSGSTVKSAESARMHLREAAEELSTRMFALARVNVEHSLSPCPSSEFSAMGDVTALSTEDITEGPLAGILRCYSEDRTYRTHEAACRGRQENLFQYRTAPAVLR